MKNQAVDYRRKYMELRAKFLSSLDMAFRMGYEEGGKDAQIDQAMAAMQPQIDPETGQPIQGAPGQPGQPGQQGPEPMPEEMDQHIAELEQAVQKAERAGGDLSKSEFDLASIKKALGGIKAYKEHASLAKSLKSIRQLGALTRSRQLGLSAQRNLDHHSKIAVSMQNKIVTDVMKKWEEQESKTTKEIANTLGVEGLLDKLTKKD